ncbi:hypothetical protein DNTS_009821 [Danionella cerebrum]|uniref:Galectin n=1 Tax=Danionella cerebrum TaxID=2873325 RepID=A0A553MXK8_9TELE|nr:hypothetical protein DNTS_009821 [Danionella translucida]
MLWAPLRARPEKITDATGGSYYGEGQNLNIHEQLDRYWNDSVENTKKVLSSIMSCPSGHQGLYPQTPQQSSGIMWTGQGCPPCWTCQPNQINYPANQLPTSWTIQQPNQSGWPNMIQPNPPFQTNPPIQPAQPISTNQPVQPTQPLQPIPSNPLIQPSQPTSPTPNNPQIQPVSPIQPNNPPTQPPPTWNTPQTGYLPSPIPPGWHGNPGQSGWPGQGSTGGSQHSWPPAPATAPVVRDLNQFTVNFLRGNDIALHINPRFNEGGKPVLVRNHKLGERWGKEERELLGPFPFMPGHHFEMKILCTVSDFKVSVNNTPCFDFLHRIREVNQIDRINILHDVTLSSVTVDTLP